MKLEIEIKKRLSPREYKSFLRQAKAHDRSIEEHAACLLLGDRELTPPLGIDGPTRSNHASASATQKEGN